MTEGSAGKRKGESVPDAPESTCDRCGRCCLVNVTAFLTDDDFERWQILLDDFLAYSVGNPVYPGIGANYDDFEAIVQRIEAARQAGAAGHAVFSYGALNKRGYWDKLARGPYVEPASLPGRPSGNVGTVSS